MSFDRPASSDEELLELQKSIQDNLEEEDNDLGLKQRHSMRTSPTKIQIEIVDVDLYTVKRQYSQEDLLVDSARDGQKSLLFF